MFKHPRFPLCFKSKRRDCSADDQRAACNQCVLIGRRSTPPQVFIITAKGLKTDDNTIWIRFALNCVQTPYPQTRWSKSQVANVTNVATLRMQSDAHSACKVRRRLNWRRLCRLQEAEYKRNQGQRNDTGCGSTFSVWRRKTIFLPSWKWMRECGGASCLMFIPCWLALACSFTHWSSSSWQHASAVCGGSAVHDVQDGQRQNGKKMFGLVIRLGQSPVLLLLVSGFNEYKLTPSFEISFSRNLDFWKKKKKPKYVSWIVRHQRKPPQSHKHLFKTL